MIVVATGAKEDRPEVFGLGYLEGRRRAWTSSGCSPSATRASTMSGRLGFICVPASLDERTPYCSRTRGQGIKNAIRLKERDPDRPVYVWFKEIRTAGLAERHYTRARELGVIFTRYQDDDPPVVSADGSVEVEFHDPSLRERIRVPSTSSCSPPRRSRTTGARTSRGRSGCRSHSTGSSSRRT